MHWRRKWQPTPVFLPGEFEGRWTLVGCRLWGRTELDTAEATQQQQQQQQQTDWQYLGWGTECSNALLLSLNWYRLCEGIYGSTYPALKCI